MLHSSRSCAATRPTYQPPWMARKHRSANRKTLVLNGHPDPRSERFCAALCSAYTQGAQSAGSNVQELRLGSLLLPADGELQGGAEHRIGSEDLNAAYEMVRWASQLIVVFPLWLNGPPLVLRQFFNDMMLAEQERGAGFSALGDSARAAHIIVTMELPAFAHRLLFRTGADSLEAENPMLLPGLRIEDATFIGSVDAISPSKRVNWLQTVREIGVARD